MTRTPKPTGRRIRKFAVRVAVSALILGVVLLFVEPERVADGFRRTRLSVWTAVLAAFVFLHAVSAMKWRYFLGLAGVPIAAPRALRCHAAGLFGNLCLPSLIGGDLVRVTSAMTATRSRTALVVGSVVDRMADTVALLALALSGFALVAGKGDDLPGPARVMVVLAAALALGAAGLWLGLALLLRRRPEGRGGRFLFRRGLETVRAIRRLRSAPIRALAGWLVCVGIQGGFVLVNAALGHSMGLRMDFGLWLLLWPLAKIAAMVPVSFGGLGVREAAFAALVAPFGPEAVAVAQSLVWQSVLIAGGLIGGGVYAAGPRAEGAEQP